MAFLSALTLALASALPGLVLLAIVAVVVVVLIRTVIRRRKKAEAAQKARTDADDQTQK